MTLPDFKGNFMPTMISAHPGTYIVEIGDSGAILKTPVVAWAPDAENPYRAPHPITLDGLSRLITGRAILHPCGFVQSRDHAICFGSLDEWAAVAAKGPRSAEPQPRARPAAPTPRKPADTTPDALSIEWASSAFKNNSFYRYQDGALDFIFQIDGGTLPPKQKGAVTKIKRDEFMVLKKTVDVAEVEDLREGRAPGLDEIGEFENPDDDEDLISGSSEDEDDEDLI